MSGTKYARSRISCDILHFLVQSSLLVCQSVCFFFFCLVLFFVFFFLLFALCLSERNFKYSLCPHNAASLSTPASRPTNFKCFIVELLRFVFCVFFFCSADAKEEKHSSTSLSCNQREYIYEELVGKGSGRLWDNMDFWETLFGDLVANERQAMGLTEDPVQLIER